MATHIQRGNRSFFELLYDGFSRTGSQLIYLLMLVSLPNILLQLLVGPSYGQEPNSAFILSMVAGFLLSPLMFALPFLLLRDVDRGQSISPKGLVIESYQRAPKVIASMFIYMLLYIVGIMLFIIPGLVVLYWGTLLLPVILLENGSIRESFYRSKKLMRGNFFRAFALFSCLGVLGVCLNMGIYFMVKSDMNLFMIYSGYAGKVMMIFWPCLTYEFYKETLAQEEHSLRAEY